MPIPEKGLPAQEILDQLESFKATDLPWRTGKVMAYNYLASKEAEELTKQAFMAYLGENALDPSAIKSVLKVETEVVRMVADLLRGGPEVVGNFTSGGTESILLAIKTYRDRARALKPHIKEPEMILPISAHGAFFKAGKYFDVKPVVMPIDPQTFLVDPEEVKKAITPNTIMLMGSAPGYGQGVIDPIEALGKIALEHDLGLHVDGCVGGIQLSFMRDMGYTVPDFDFTVPGVTSISTDMHKYGYAAKGASIILWKDKSYRKFQIFATAASTTYAIVNSVVMSTRSGGSAAGAWAILHFLGKEGYRKIFKEVMDATTRLIEGINATGDLRVLGKPDMCMFSFASDTINVFQLADEMVTEGWYIQPQLSTPYSPPNLHISVNASTLPMVEPFLAALPGAIAATKAKPKLDFAVVKKQVDQMVTSFGDQAGAQLKAMAGFGQAGDMPKEFAFINTIMDALPRDLTADLLTEFWNELYV